jgi:predicted lysophospholipase L1 biosynthesis ABC-type transport system permease subunit
MNRYLPPIVVETAPDLGRAFGYVWAAAMAAVALANLAVALGGDLKTWSWFVSVGPVSVKASLGLAQFAVIRITMRRRLRRRMATGPEPCPSEILDPWSPASLAIAGAD